MEKYWRKKAAKSVLPSAHSVRFVDARKLITFSLCLSFGRARQGDANGKLKRKQLLWPNGVRMNDDELEHESKL